MASLILRGSTYYIQFMEGGTARRESTRTDSLQVAKEKLRQHESGQARGAAVLPTRTPVARVLGAYINHIRTAHTPKSVQTTVYYLRDAFGPVCDELKLTSRKPSATTKKRPPKPGQDRRRKAPVISAPHFEAISKGQVSSFIDGRMASRGIAPKTANRIRDTLSALFSWAMNEYDIRMPGDLNPVSKVKKRKVEQQDIQFLSLEEVEEQLKALKDDVKMQTMVATMIYAGLRREELLWLRPQDIRWNEGPYGLIRICTKSVAGERWCAKTKKNRSIPISSDLRPFLDKWRLEAPSGTWFFPNTANGRYDPDNFSRDLRAANAAKNLAWSNLDFRHTFASILASRGESLYLIATLMGNSYQICERHYSGINKTALFAAVEFKKAEPLAAAS